MSDERNPLELSDEEIMNMPPPAEPEVEEEIAEEAEVEVEETEDEQDEEEEDEGTETTETTDEEDDDEDEIAESDDKEEVDEDEEAEEDETPEKLDTTDNAAGTKKKDSVEKVDNTIDYEAEYKKLVTPFKASGRTVNVNGADEAIQMMQMGVDYNKKMAGLRPSLKLLKMLENNNLLDEGKLSYLIDLDKKNPEAITKLLKESGMDPLEVDVSADTEYKPNTYTVDDKQVELDSVLGDIKDTPTYANTLDIIGNKWDESSKRALYDAPEDIRFINEQVASGVYQQIDDLVQKQRMLGNLRGLSDIDAYRTVGTYMQDKQLFTGQTPITEAPVNVQTKQPVTNDSPKLKNRKKAAGGTRKTPKKAKKQNYNPLALSDEEFEKMAAPLT